MADSFDRYGPQRISSPDSLGSKVRVITVGDLPWDRSTVVNVKAMFPDVDGTISVTDADSTNAQTGISVKAGVVLNFIPERITAFGTITKLYYVL